MISEQVSLKDEINQLENDLIEKQKKLLELKRQLKQPSVKDYTLKSVDGKEIRLSEIFGNKSDLIVVHNMGVSCSYCTMWADGFNGLLSHLENRAGFALVSPDTPDTQNELARKRGWKFKIYSCADSTISEDLGFKNENGWLPGVSTFHRNADSKIVNIHNEYFGPGDLFCSTWHLFDLLANGTDGWQPKLEY